MKRVVVTGADGFIGKNLVAQLETDAQVTLIPSTRADDLESIRSKLEGCDIIYHLAGTNRPTEDSLFSTENFEFTRQLFLLRQIEKKPFVFVYASSTQADLPNPYGE